MNPLISILIGYTSTFLLIVSFSFELYQNYKYQKANITYGFIILQFSVNILQLIYNIYMSAIPLIIGNASIAFMTFILAGQKYYYDRQKMEMIDHQFDSQLISNNELESVV